MGVLIKEKLMNDSSYYKNKKKYYVYILASKRNGTLYIGFASNLIKRIYEHKNNLIDGFTKKYNIYNLVYYEITEDVNSAIAREKQLKRWKRNWKIELIEKNNSGWKDLYFDLI
jgi:putative endonuclease